MNFKFSRDADVWLRFWSWCLIDYRYSKDEIWSRVVFELVIWPKQVTMVSWTEPFGSVVPLAMFEACKGRACFAVMYLAVGDDNIVRQSPIKEFFILPEQICKHWNVSSLVAGYILKRGQFPFQVVGPSCRLDPHQEGRHSVSREEHKLQQNVTQRKNQISHCHTGKEAFFTFNFQTCEHFVTFRNRKLMCTQLYYIIWRMPRDIFLCVNPYLEVLIVAMV